MGWAMALALLAGPSFGQAVPTEADEPVAASVATPWWVGLPIAEVALLAPEGGLPEESLQPLLRATSGEMMTATDLRLDIATLYRVGEFSAVEASVDKWVTYDATGELVPAVKLAYSVYPAQRVDTAWVQGHAWLRERDILSAARIEPGIVFYGGLDAEPARARIVEYARRQGFPDAVVEIDTIDGEEGLELIVRLDEGEPQLVKEVRFSGELPVEERVMRRWVKRAGIAPGKPLSPDSVQGAQYELRQRLATGGTNPWSLTRAWFKRRQVGWVTARIGAVVNEVEDGYWVTYTVEPGPLLSLEVSGLTWRGPQKVQSALGVDERLRLTRGFVDSAPDKVEEPLLRGGWRDVEATVELSGDDTEQTLSVDIVKGPRHVLRSRLFAPPNSNFHGVVFEGNDELLDWQLRTVVEQASPDVIRVGHLTDDELAAGLKAVRELYRANGYPSAEVEVADVEVYKRFSAASLPLIRQFHEAATASPPPVSVQARVDVREGRAAKLTELLVVGAADDVQPPGFVEARDGLVGGPYSPQRIDALARILVAAHREAGYLEADARVVEHIVDEETRHAEIVVQTGPKILLRSVVTRGTRHTKPAFVRNQIDLDLGAPVTSTALDEVRTDLYDLGVFSGASTTLLGDGDARDLVVSVEERGRNALEFGPGLSTDQGLRMTARYTRRNIFRIAHRAEFNTLVGIAGYEADDLEFRAALSYTAPRFPIRSQQLVLDALLQERLVERNYELARTGAGAFLSSRTGKTTIRAGSRFEFRRIVDYDPGIIVSGEPWEAVIADEDRKWRPAHTLSAQVVHDRRNDPLQPTRGGLVSVASEFSPPLGSDVSVSFAKLDFVASGFVPIRSGVRLLLSGEGGHARVLGSGVIPVEDRYRLGGTASMRGFRRNAVGPFNEVARTSDTGLGAATQDVLGLDTSRWVPTGGDTMAVGTAELIMPFTALGLVTWDGWSGAVFTDVGNTWLLNPDAQATSEEPATADVFSPIVRYSVGAGVQIDTPVGPLRVDGALNPEAAMARSDSDRKALLIDQWHEPRVRLHLSIGTLF